MRQCSCGKFTLFKELVEIDTAESSDLPYINRVPSELLPVCIATADNEEIEVAARLEYWRELNHAYRERYRTHRDAEEAANKAMWEVQNPDTRTLWDKLRGREAPTYIRTESMPFTVPDFEPSPKQLENMDRLCEIFHKRSKKSIYVDKQTFAELYREQGRFIEAQGVISLFQEHDEGIKKKLIMKLIKEEQNALIRYRM